MTTLKKIYIEHEFGGNRTICIVWKNDRYQRIEIESGSPKDVAVALRKAADLVDEESATAG